MKKGAIVTVVALALIAAALIQTYSNAQRDPVPKAHQQWEYKAVGITDIREASESLADTERRLNEKFGAEGWELCGADSALWVFKRPKK